MIIGSFAKERRKKGVSFDSNEPIDIHPRVGVTDSHTTSLT
jgi:hypothetical protein